MKPKITSNYIVVRLKGDVNHFSQSGYSKYNDRFREKYSEGKDTIIYGIEQAREHIEELKQSVYDNKKHYADKEFEIVRIVITEEILE